MPKRGISSRATRLGTEGEDYGEVEVSVMKAAISSPLYPVLGAGLPPARKRLGRSVCEGCLKGLQLVATPDLTPSADAFSL